MELSKFMKVFFDRYEFGRRTLWLIVCIAILFIVIAVAPVQAGLGSPQLTISCSPNPIQIERGGTGTLTVTIAEVRGEDFAFNLRVNPTHSSVRFSPGFETISRVNRYGTVSKQFSLSVPATAPLGTSSGGITVIYYETGWLDLGTYGPYNKNGTFSVNVMPGSGSLMVTSNPSVADVYVNGVLKGKTPYSLSKITEGRHTILIKKDGYEDHTESVNIAVGKISTVSPTLKKKSGSLSITSSPTGAVVYFNGNYQGKTPLSISNIQPGTHRVLVTMEGYNDYSTTITLRQGDSRSISATLHQNLLNSVSTTITDTVGIDAYLIGGILGVGLLFIGILLTSRSKRRRKSISNSISSERPRKQIEETYVKEREIAPREESLQTEKDKNLYGYSKNPEFPKELITRYELQEFVGEGGFAKVYKVRRISDGAIVAIKIPRINEKTSSIFIKEVAGWYHLTHPNIVKLNSADLLPIPHLEMEYVDGIRMNQKIFRDLDSLEKPIPKDWAVKIIYEISLGLQYAHQKGVYHHDLKPFNVLITSDKAPKIADFGLSKISSRSSMTTNKGYSPLYVAPEQLDSNLYGKPDHRTDIYHLGMIFFELLTGVLPYDGSSPGVIIGKIVSEGNMPSTLKSINPEYAVYDPIISKLIAKRMENRFQSVDEFQEALESVYTLNRERQGLIKDLKQTMASLKFSSNTDEITKFTNEAIQKSARIALLNAQLQDRVELINALNEIRILTSHHQEELGVAIDQVQYMIAEDLPLGNDWIDQLRILLGKIGAHE